MKKKYAMKWIKALRSGEYKQGQPGKMQDDEGGYCCLGVLREICRSSGGPQILTNSEASLVGMRSLLGVMPGITLTELNDGAYVTRHRTPSGQPERFTFEEIADIIEQEWPNL